MKLLLQAISLAVGVLMLAGTASAGSASDRTKTIWQRHITDWNERDLDGIVADYSEDATVVLVDRVYRGRDEIRTLFAWLFRSFDRATEHNIDPVLIDGRLVYFTWSATIDGVAHPFGTDTFLIENGFIVYQTITTDRRFFEHL